MDYMGENEMKLLQDRGLCVRTNFPARIFGEWCAGCLAASRDRPFNGSMGRIPHSGFLPDHPPRPWSAPCGVVREPRHNG